MPRVAQWHCPHCLSWSSLEDEQYTTENVSILPNKDSLSHLRVWVVVCKNSQCGKATIGADLIGMRPKDMPAGYQKGRELGTIRYYSLVPASKAKPQPPYIPQQIVSDYEEAFLIAELSPKASATLSRRCLQGMIRDFFSISRNRLFDEIDAIKDQTPPDVWDAIDAVRKVGNIGAHMEKDINVIVDVDEREAGLLLELIEQLFDDWYVTRHKRQERLIAIKTMALEKDAQKTGAPGPLAEPEASTPTE